MFLNQEVLHMRLTKTLTGAMVFAAMLIPALPVTANAANATLNAAGEGRRVWLKLNCYGCHGNNAAGGMGPNIQHAESGDVAQAMAGDAIEGGMRSFKGYYASKDAANVAAYLATIGTKNEPTWLDWWNANP
jgi:mono/diheme cytochrome c family protein